jgi:K(+)-stimulated pyrophosphate-energized sodium pump
MYTATSANARTAQACERNIAHGLQVAFASGAVMGNGVVALALTGLWSLYLIWTAVHPESREDPHYFDMVWGYLAGFGFGASSIGMFARVGGGVFTKAADVGADLVGKVEQGIPEDDARNPAVIADNVGDNVGDVAGMGADLFESYAGALIATATLSPELWALAGPKEMGGSGWTDMTLHQTMMAGTALPFWVYGLGIPASLFGISLVRNYPLDNEKTTLHALLRLINNGVYLATVLTIGTSIACCVSLFDSPMSWRLVGAIVIGLLAGVVIANFTEYCTSYEESPTRNISAASEFGPAPVIIKGLGIGMMSVSVPTISIVITILACNALAGLYGVSIAAVGMLSTLSITLATDAYGPVADNAGGLAEMAGMPEWVRSRTDRLDSLGNTTAATGKGLAIGSALLTAVGLIAAFLTQSGVGVVDVKDAITLSGVLIGCGLPFVFGALTMLSVDRGARSIIVEVRRQFATAPELLDLPKERTNDLLRGSDGKMYPDAERCVQIATEAAIQEMVLPGMLAVFVPVGCGFLLGPKGLGGLLAGSLGTCFMLALTMANAGGAWDNAKKWCEKCANEGEPTTVNGQPALTYTFFGVKTEDAFEHAQAGLPADQKYSRLVKPGHAAPSSPAEVAALRETLLELYHTRHAGTVTGDTVGDPFKDTSGPALNVLSKTMTMVALMLAPAYRALGTGEDEDFTGFRPYGTITAAVMLVVVGAICMTALIYFGRLREQRDNEAKRLKAEADVKRANRGHTATAAVAHEVANPVATSSA